MFIPVNRLKQLANDWWQNNFPSLEGLFRALAAGAAIIALSGCGNGPVGPIPGGALSGSEAVFEPAKLSREPGVIVLETNPEAPYSVKVNSVNIDGNLYVDPAAERTWYKHIDANPKVRFRLDGSDAIYPATAVPETEPSIIEQFEPDRIVLRLDPR